MGRDGNGGLLPVKHSARVLNRLEMPIAKAPRFAALFGFA
jgi:hypothetical protein